MTSLPHLPDVKWPHSYGSGVDFSTLELVEATLLDFSDFQDHAFQSFDATLSAALDLKSEFSSLIICLNQLPRDIWPRLHKDRLLQRIVSQTLAPRSEPCTLHISLGRQFSRIFLKRRKVEYLLNRLKCALFGETEGKDVMKHEEFSLKVFTSLLPVREMTLTRRGAPLLSGKTSCICRLADPIAFSFRFNDITADFPGGVLSLVVSCSNLDVEPLVIPNITVKVMRKQFRFTSD